MEQKMVHVPFDLDMAKKITNGEINGKIFDNHYKCYARIVDFDFETNQGKLNVIISERGKGKEVFAACNDEGVIFLENKFDDIPVFFLEIPEYMTFKNGDVIVQSWNKEDGRFCRWVSIIKDIEVNDDGQIVTHDYFTVMIDADKDNVFKPSFGSTCDSSEIAISASELEKKIVISALKERKEPIAKEYLKRFFGIEQNDEPKLNPGQPVIGMDGNGKWRYDFFSHYSTNGMYVCTGRSYYKCLPYNEKTANLLGTNKDYE